MTTKNDDKECIILKLTPSEYKTVLRLVIEYEHQLIRDQTLRRAIGFGIDEPTKGFEFYKKIKSVDPNEKGRINRIAITS